MGAAKRIGILTSGGDCAGLNAVIRAVGSEPQGALMRTARGPGICFGD